MSLCMISSSHWPHSNLAVNVRACLAMPCASLLSVCVLTKASGKLHRCLCHSQFEIVHSAQCLYIRWQSDDVILSNWFTLLLLCTSAPFGFVLRPVWSWFKTGKVWTGRPGNGGLWCITLSADLILGLFLAQLKQGCTPYLNGFFSFLVH